MKKITLEQVIFAYQKTGLEPCAGHFFVQNWNVSEALFWGSCPVGAMASEFNECFIGQAANAYIWAQDTFGEAYIDGFINGFDEACFYPKVEHTPSAEYNKGHKDGVIVGIDIFKYFKNFEPNLKEYCESHNLLQLVQ